MAAAGDLLVQTTRSCVSQPGRLAVGPFVTSLGRSKRQTVTGETQRKLPSVRLFRVTERAYSTLRRPHRAVGPSEPVAAPSGMTRVVAIAAAVLSVGGVAVDALIFDYFGILLVIPIALLPLGLVGAVLVARIPGNRIGWLLALAGVALELLFAGSAYGWAALVRGPGSLPYGELGAIVGNGTFAPALGSLVLLLLFFPTGRGLGGRWTWVERSIVGLIVAIVVINLFKEAPLQLNGPLATPDSGSTFIANPLALHGVAASVISSIAFLAESWTIVVVLIGPVSLLVRYRRSSAIERAQIKWIAYAGTLAFALLVASDFIPGDLSNWLWAGGVVALGLLPMAIALAIFRYRLYDIDLLIRRTLIYAAVSAVLLAAYVAGVALFQLVLAPITAGSGVAVAISTLAVLALFQPVRRRIQEGVDRRFYRSRYDAARTLDSFAVRLRDEVDLDAVRADLLGSVQQAMAPAHMSLWLRER
jgi:hypothetical protein